MASVMFALAFLGNVLQNNTDSLFVELSGRADILERHSDTQMMGKVLRQASAENEPA